jgi:hypothetical protein
MTLLLRSRAVASPTEALRARRDVLALVKKAPTGARTLAWWQAWLAANW